MEMRRFLHHTKDSYYRKAKDVIKYFKLEKIKAFELIFVKLFNAIIKIKIKHDHNFLNLKLVHRLLMSILLVVLKISV